MSPSARLFIGLELTEAVKSALSAASARVPFSAGKLYGPELYHLTVCFLGQVERRRMGCLEEAMIRAAAGPLPLRLAGLGTFQQGRILWAGVERPAQQLMDTEARLRAALRERSFVLDERPYAPHITLGRQMRLTGALPRVAPVAFVVRQLTLFESGRVDGVLAYTPLIRINL